MADAVQARGPGRYVTIRVGWMVAAFLALTAAQVQGWIDLPTWVFWVLGVPVALLVLVVLAAWLLHRVLTRRFQRVFREASEHMQAWQRERSGPGPAGGDIVEGEVIEDDDEPVRVRVEDPDE